MTGDTEHRTRVEEVPEGFQVLCSCGWVGRTRKDRFDAGEDEIAHHDTGAGPRTLDEILEREEEQSYLGKIGAGIRRLRPRGPNG